MNCLDPWGIQNSLKTSKFIKKSGTSVDNMPEVLEEHFKKGVQACVSAFVKDAHLQGNLAIMYSMIWSKMMSNFFDRKRVAKFVSGRGTGLCPSRGQIQRTFIEKPRQRWQSYCDYFQKRKFKLQQERCQNYIKSKFKENHFVSNNAKSLDQTRKTGIGTNIWTGPS